MRHSLIRTLAVALFLLVPANVARAESQNFRFVDQSVTIDSVQRSADFRITFDQPPSFTAVAGTQLESFQYEIDTSSDSAPKPIHIDTVIRGAEIWLGNGIPIRDAQGDGGPNSGGWGPVRATIPFQVADDTLMFTTSWNNLGDDDGIFRYRLFTTDSGATTATVEGTTASIPLPPGVWTGMIALGAIVAGAKVRRFAL